MAKKLTQNDVKNHASFSIDDAIYIGDDRHTIVKVVNVSFVFKMGRADVYIDYQWRTDNTPMYQTQKGASLENFRKMIIDWED